MSISVSELFPVKVHPFLKNNPFMPSGLVYHNSLDRFILKRRDIRLVFIVTMFYRNEDFIVTMFYRNDVFNTNSVDPDQTPHPAASDLGLLCLSVSLLWDARRK